MDSSALTVEILPHSDPILLNSQLVLLINLKTHIYQPP